MLAATRKWARADPARGEADLRGQATLKNPLGTDQAYWRRQGHEIVV